MTPKIQIAEARKTFHTPAGEVHVLDGVSLAVGRGEFLAVVGPSGCGKSTLLNCVAGFEALGSGSIRVDGEEVHGPSRQRVAVFQDTAIFPWLSVEENIGFGLRGAPAERKRDTVRRYVRLFGLEGFEAAIPAALSGGMRQRVEFARALAVEPEVLLLDEPFGALDALTRAEMRRELARILTGAGRTCILVTHDVAEALELADRVAVMTRRPAHIRAVLDVPLARPRDPDTAAWQRLRDEILRLLGVERPAPGELSREPPGRRARAGVRRPSPG